MDMYDYLRLQYPPSSSSYYTPSYYYVPSYPIPQPAPNQAAIDEYIRSHPPALTGPPVVAVQSPYVIIPVEPPKKEEEKKKKKSDKEELREWWRSLKEDERQAIREGKYEKKENKQSKKKGGKEEYDFFLVWAYYRQPDYASYVLVQQVAAAAI
jgi:hypothetical protein